MLRESGYRPLGGVHGAKATSPPSVGLKQGEAAPSKMTFCPWNLIASYPSGYIGNANRDPRRSVLPGRGAAEQPGSGISSTSGSRRAQPGAPCSWCPPHSLSICSPPSTASSARSSPSLAGTSLRSSASASASWARLGRDSSAAPQAPRPRGHAEQRAGSGSPG